MAKKSTPKRPRPPPIQEDMFLSADPGALPSMEMSGLQEKLRIMQDQFDEMKRIYLEMKQANEFYRKELGL